jgi:hypothetical protein
MFRFLLDEHLRGKVANFIRRRNATGLGVHLEIVVLGEPPDLPRGTLDPQILLWTEREGSLFVTYDKRSLPGHLSDHLDGGHHLPGILCIRRPLSAPRIAGELEIIELAGQPEDFVDNITYLP